MTDPRHRLRLTLNRSKLTALGGTVRRTPSGGLLSEGHDLGKDVADFWGEGITE